MAVDCDGDIDVKLVVAGLMLYPNLVTPVSNNPHGHTTISCPALQLFLSCNQYQPSTQPVEYARPRSCAHLARTTYQMTGLSSVLDTPATFDGEKASMV